ncbi:MAG: domain S-box protein [Mucilaginibacter sp.]|nr:domain S-box protein [Mucilaginibacter sp.]
MSDTPQLTLDATMGKNHQIPVAKHFDFNHLPIAVYTCDNLGYITSFNKAAEVLWGRKPEIGKDLWCGSWKIFYTNGEPMDLDTCPMAITLKEGRAVEGKEILIERPDNTRVKVRPYPVPVFDEDGLLTGAINTLVDVTNLTEGEEKRAILAAIVDTSDDTILSKTLQGIITSWNKAAEKMFGYTESEALGKHISLIIPPDRLDEEKHIISEISKGNTVDHFQTIRVAKNGRKIPISVSISPIIDSNGNIIGASKIARDISEQRAANEAIRRYTERLEIINAITETISEDLDLSKILQKVTDATTRLTGAQFGAFFYNNIDANDESFMLYTLSGASKEAFEKYDMPRNTAVFKMTFNGEGVVRVADITKDDRYGRSAPHYGMPPGHLPVVSYLAVPVTSRSGSVIGGLFFGHPEPDKFTAEHEDIVTSIAGQAAIGIDNAILYEEIKNLNEKKDEFIGLASHELKTPLTSISGYLQIISRLNTDDNTQKFVDKTANQVKKLTSLVSDLLDVSKIEAGKLQLAKEEFDIRTVINNVIELIHFSNVSYQISLDTDIESLTMIGDPDRIEQVLINLLNNAIKYSPGNNKVKLLLSHSDREVKIGVKDFGIGIAPDNLTKVFTRFYRVEGTNHTISGLGIGLYLSNEIIIRHHGKLWVESELGKGSTFWLTLPLFNNTLLPEIN